MSLEVYVLSLLTAITWGMSPVFVKRGLSEGGSSLHAAIMTVSISSSLYWLVLIVRDSPGGLFSSLSLWDIGLFLFAGLVGTAIGRLLYYAGVRRIGSSIANAGANTRPLFASILAIAFIGENVTVGHGIGVLVLVVGLVVLTLSKGGNIGGWETKNMVFPLGTAIAFAVGNVVRRFGLHETSISVLEAIAINEIAALAVLVAYLLVQKDKRLFTIPRRSFMYFTVSGVLSATGLLFLFGALDRGTVVVVDPLVGTQTLFATFFAFLFLRDIERVTRQTIFGVALIVIGVGLVTTM